MQSRKNALRRSLDCCCWFKLDLDHENYQKVGNNSLFFGLITRHDVFCTPPPHTHTQNFLFLGKDNGSVLRTVAPLSSHNHPSRHLRVHQLFVRETQKCFAESSGSVVRKYITCVSDTNLTFDTLVSVINCRLSDGAVLTSCAHLGRRQRITIKTLNSGQAYIKSCSDKCTLFIIKKMYGTNNKVSGQAITIQFEISFPSTFYLNLRTELCKNIFSRFKVLKAVTTNVTSAGLWQKNHKYRLWRLF